MFRVHLFLCHAWMRISLMFASLHGIGFFRLVKLGNCQKRRKVSFHHIIHAFFTSKLDYNNGLLSGVPDTLLGLNSADCTC